MTEFLHSPRCGCIDCLNRRNVFRVIDRDDAPPHGRVLHKIGRCVLSVHVYRKQKTFEVIWDGKIIASARDWPQDAIHQARLKLRKPRHKVYGEIFAYRGWNLVGYISTPVSRQDDWGSWEGPVATVSEIEENGPNGLYAVKLEHSRSLLASYRPMVHGIVGLSGIVIEYERGYRAQRQVVRVLRVVPPVGDAIIKALEDRYQCQVFRQKH